MFQVDTQLFQGLGFYHTVLDNELIKDLKKRAGYLNMKSVEKSWRPNNNLIITVCFKGLPAQLLLTKIYEMCISILYLVKEDKFIITNHRFDPSLYNNTVLFGELLNDSFIIHTVNFGNECEKTAESLERLDGILFNKYKEDLDLEPIQLSIKEFYNEDNEIIWRNEYKGIIYLNQTVRGQHFIKFR